MTEHALAFFLNEAFDAGEGASTDDPIQGSVTVRTIGGSITGQISWVSEDGQAFGICRVWDSLIRGGEVVERDRAECPRYFATAHVVEIFYHEAGA